MIDFFIKKGDVLPVLRVQLTNEDLTPVNLSGSAVYFNYQVRSSGTTVVNRLAYIEDPTSGIVQYQWVSGDSLTAGLYKAEFVTRFSGSPEQTFPQGRPLIFEVVEDIS